MATDPYRRATPVINFYATSTGGGEADMRQELIDTFDGKTPEVAKAQTALLRRMRLDANERKIPCACVDNITKEPDKDRFCPVCYGEGFLWDEEELQIYRTLANSTTDSTMQNKLRELGLINIPLVVFYIRYDSQITRHDKIVRIELGLDGSPVTPRSRVGIYRVNTAWDYRADNGKLEYWKVFTHQEDVKYLNPPSYDLA